MHFLRVEFLLEIKSRIDLINKIKCVSTLYKFARIHAANVIVSTKCHLKQT